MLCTTAFNTSNTSFHCLSNVQKQTKFKAKFQIKALKTTSHKYCVFYLFFFCLNCSLKFSFKVRVFNSTHFHITLPFQR